MSNTTVVIRTAYNPVFINLVKAGIPKHLRRYDPVFKQWEFVVTDGVRRVLRDICLKAGVAVPSGLEALEDIVSSVGSGVEYSEELREQLAKELPRTLFPYQVAGVAFALKTNKALIADEMGLGKTIQALAWLKCISSERVLILCPGAVRLNWVAEIRQWLGVEPTVICSQGDKKRLQAAGYQVAHLADRCPQGIIVVNYEAVSRAGTIPWDAHINTLILDESHYLKTTKSSRTKAVLRFVRQHNPAHILCLSGTPIRNHPAEFFSTLHILRPHIFANEYKYLDRYTNAVRVRIGRGRHITKYVGVKNASELVDILNSQSIMIRREKKDVFKDLPPLLVQEVPVDIESKDIDEEIEVIRQLKEADAFDEHIATLRRLLGEAKATAWAGVIVDAAHQPVVVFYHHHSVLAILRKALDEAEVPHGIIVGGQSATDRQQTIDAFQAGNFNILLVSTLAGGVGINLTRAHLAFMVEREWVPADEDQAWARLHRIGQQMPVHIQVLVAAHWVDRLIAKTLSVKRRDIAALNGAGTVADILKTAIAAVT